LTVPAASYLHCVKQHSVAIIDCDYPQHSIAEMRNRDVGLAICQHKSVPDMYAVFCITEIIFLKYGAKEGWIFRAAVEGATQTAATGDANRGHRLSMRKISLSLYVPLCRIIRMYVSKTVCRFLKPFTGTDKGRNVSKNKPGCWKTQLYMDIIQ
jgi:hypothetical protein